MAKVIMIQGTMSNAGKSFLVAGLCRIFKQDGWRVAPFKSQNMALNSFITKEGLEMGRAQVMQAEAAGIDPMVCMNPILLKPTNHTGSQVIVNGEVIGNMSARDYFAYKKQLIPDIRKAFRKLEEYADIIVIEGAGSPAEINLKENDIVNMGLAQMLDAPVLLVGDIDRGGVFAQLLGTLMLLTEEERKRVKGLIINKFRGDKSILDPGITMLEEKGGVPVTGVVPYMELALEDEDSLTGRFDRKKEGLIDIAVIHYPRISNFTDFNVFEQFPEVTVRYVTSISELHHPDLSCGEKISRADPGIRNLRRLSDVRRKHRRSRWCGRGRLYPGNGIVICNDRLTEGEAALPDRRQRRTDRRTVTGDVRKGFPGLRNSYGKDIVERRDRRGFAGKPAGNPYRSKSECLRFLCARTVRSGTDCRGDCTGSCKEKGCFPAGWSDGGLSEL